MRDLPFLIRFFHVVPPVPPMMTGTFLVLTLASAAVVFANPVRAPGALVPVLLLQVFAAASGFALPARRGHFDLLLTRGSSRTLIALVHWAMSIAPGLATWLVLAVVESGVRGATDASLLASGTCAAVFVVSTLPWALTVALPRFSGAIGWMLVSVTAGTFSSGLTGSWTLHSTRLDEVIWVASTFLIYPVGAIGQPLSGAQLMAAMPAVIAAIGALTAACRWIARRDVPLEAAQ